MTTTKGEGMATSSSDVRQGLTANRPWGRMEMTSERYLTLTRRGSLRVRVYPPGTTQRQRAMLFARYGLTSWVGGVFAVAAAVIVGAVVNVYAGLAVALVSGVAAVVVRVLSASVAGRVRQVRFPLAVRDESRGRGSVYVAARRDRFAVLVRHLDQLDADASDLSPVDYEVRWGRVYDQLEVSQ